MLTLDFVVYKRMRRLQMYLLEQLKEGVISTGIEEAVGSKGLRFRQSESGMFTRIPSGDIEKAVPYDFRVKV